MMTETITWFPASAPPDVDTTVMIELNPDFEYSEPVFMGYYEGDGHWRDVHGVHVQVIRWAELPKGGDSQ